MSPQRGLYFTPRGAPERIVCLTEEPTEILYALGQQRRIVGISAYTERPPCAKREHPVVSAFIGGSVKKIAALKPDLIIGFSDIQAQLAHDLIKHNLPVLIFNQRSIQEILEVIVTLGTLVDARDEALCLVDGYVERLEAVRLRARAREPRRVYFEEWDDPLICSIQWVHELIELTGAVNVFADRASGKLAKERFLTHAEVIEAAPEVILASWCGKPVDIASILHREGYAGRVPALQTGEVHELDPAIILQPGPACLTDGLDRLEALIYPDRP